MAGVPLMNLPWVAVHLEHAFRRDPPFALDGVDLSMPGIRPVLSLLGQ